VSDPQSERERTARRQGLAYQGAFEAVFAILIGAGLGYWADEYFETSPRWLLIGVVVGFAAFVLRLLRLGRTLHRDGAGDGEGER
jgi:F0F1-type ATP synthase assembly protein I